MRWRRGVSVRVQREEKAGSGAHLSALGSLPGIPVSGLTSGGGGREDGGSGVQKESDLMRGSEDTDLLLLPRTNN